MQRSTPLPNQDVLSQGNPVGHKQAMKSIRITEKTPGPRRVSEQRRKAAIPSLFAEGVDVGVKLALCWMEAELAHCEPTSESVQEALNKIRHRSCQIQQFALVEQAVSPAPTSHSRRVRSPARARSTAVRNISRL